MPYFTLKALPKSFVDTFCAPEITAQLPEDVVAFRVAVLSRASRARTMLLFGRLLAGQHIPDWSSTRFGAQLAEELNVEVLQQVLVYDAFDDHFHPLPIEPNICAAWASKLGLLGWFDLRDRFDLVDQTGLGNVVLKARDGSACLSRSVHVDQLPNSED